MHLACHAYLSGAAEGFTSSYQAEAGHSLSKPVLKRQGTLLKEH